MADIGEIFDAIGFGEDEALAIKMVKNAGFDLSQTDDEGRNLADYADEKMMSDLLEILRSKGINPTF